MSQSYYGAHGGTSVQQQQQQQSKVQTYYTAAGPEGTQQGFSPYYLQQMQAASNQGQNSSAAILQYSQMMQYAAHMQQAAHAAGLHGADAPESASDAG